MRVSQFLVAASSAIAVSAGIPASGDGSTPTSLDFVSSPSSLPVATAAGVHGSSQQPASSSDATVVASSHSPQSAASPSNHSSTLTAGTSLRTTTLLDQDMPADTSPAQSTATADATSHANATSSKPADATGGAILPQMQGSMAGLLGFCIMSLMLL
ncbi:hypothetical protein LLEC1_01951 [Akanthomyces lecanii]|uniref:REJ domain-containing protein n=1 Tax=Cordyceps confragosa TaxID=2714763 RepID=A0A179I759_CORDF|nr:hypothetical protein LLEC1_01951 [Akanthomyces lecanii]